MSINWKNLSVMEHRDVKMDMLRKIGSDLCEVGCEALGGRLSDIANLYYLEKVNEVEAARHVGMMEGALQLLDGMFEPKGPECSHGETY